MSETTAILPPGPIQQNGQWWQPYKQGYRPKQSEPGKGDPVLIRQYVPMTPPSEPLVPLLQFLQETLMAWDLSSIETNGEQFLISMATAAVDKARPSWFSDQDQANANAAITAAITFGAQLLINRFSAKISTAVTTAETKVDTAVAGAVQQVTATPTAATVKV